MTTQRQLASSACLAVLLASAVSLMLTANLASGQFLQPQSHLGRLVQSITSPLGLGSAAGSEDASSPYYGAGASDEAEPSRPSSGGYGMLDQEQGSPQHAGYSSQQQAAQTRGVPQQYYQAQAAYASGRQARPSQQHHYNHHHHQQHQDEDQGAPSNTRQNQQEYAMGAYLGPTMDDKEINGAFNSNDERDEDDGPASYDGGAGNFDGSGSGMAPRQKAASDSYGYGRQAANSGYGPSGEAGHSAASYGAANPSAGAYDDDSADEDEGGPPAGLRGGGRGARSGYRGGLSQAASQYQQRPARAHGNQGRANMDNGNMVAAANGYAPYGGGPMDLAGLMAGMAGGNAAGYEVYNGDGSPYGYGPSGQQAQGRRNQAASQQNGYYPNPDGYGQQQQRPGSSNNDNDDQDNDMDED